jgi:hypothetical protein
MVAALREPDWTNFEPFYPGFKDAFYIICLNFHRDLRVRSGLRTPNIGLYAKKISFWVGDFS